MLSSHRGWYACPTDAACPIDARIFAVLNSRLDAIGKQAQQASASPACGPRLADVRRVLSASVPKIEDKEPPCTDPEIQKPEYEFSAKCWCLRKDYSYGFEVGLETSNIK